MQDTILIVTEVDDVHADAVVRHLNERDISVFRLHTDEFPCEASLTIDVEGARCTGEIATVHRSVRIERIGAVWMRRPRRPRLSTDLDPGAEEYALAQARDALRGLYGVLDAMWVGEPSRLQVANIKPLQLLRASAAGLLTPRTLITNDAARIARFRRALDSAACAIKPLDVIAAQSADGWRFPLTTVLPEHAALDDAVLAPSIFQPYIDKAFEVRAVVIGNEIFAASILSQEARQHHPRLARR